MKPAVRSLLILLVLFWGVVLPCPTLVAQTQPTTAPGAVPSSAVYIVGDNDEYWVTAVLPSGVPETPVESTVYERKLGESKFAVVTRMPQRVTAMGSWAGRAIILLANGQWVSVWPGGSAIGAPLPGDARILALAGDANNVWSIGVVPGGLNTAVELATTAPATRSTTAATSTLPLRPVLFRLDRAVWKPMAELFADTIDTKPATAALHVGVDEIYATILPAGRDKPIIVAVNRNDAAVIRTMEVDAKLVSLFAGENGEPLAWARTNQTNGRFIELNPREWGKQAGEANLAKMPVAGGLSIGSALGYLRVLGAEKTIVEQRLRWDGTPIGEAEPLATSPAPDAVPPWTRYINMGIVALLAVAMLASIRHRETARLALARRDRPRPARMWVRLSAAVVDAIPVIAGIVVIYLRSKPGQILPQDFATTIPVLIGIGVYLIYTTVCELITRRTFGKLIFGLTVVNLNGDRPDASAVLIRNALRIVDLFMLPPLLIALMIWLPFRQRIGDIAAGTVVVDVTAPRMTDEIEQEE